MTSRDMEGDGRVNRPEKRERSCLRERRMLTVPEAADHLGLRPSTLRAWIAARRIGFVRLGRAIRIPASEVERLVDAGFVAAR
jgi:excisionase family DNA binding protein